ncbi:MAG: terpene cyclase/mutase family protein [Planctomycetota bacterium]|nr:terpene cyclase/mutase family protein [Planctomycetota bacterium]
MKRSRIATIVTVLAVWTTCAQADDDRRPPAKHAGPISALSTKARHDAQAAIDRGLAFLRATQRADGGWENMGQSDAAITAMIGKCFIQHKDYGASHPVVQKALALVLSFKHEDGGIYPAGLGLRNYYTSVCLMVLAATKDEKYQPHISKAQNFLKNLQWDEVEDIDESNPWYGGTGYGRNKRPDLSNTQMMLDALKQSGLPATDPTYKKALKFIQRCQNLSASNDQAFARGANDGGFVYTPANNGESKAGTVMVEGQPRLRSYGSMTYAGFKSYLYADLDRNDPRVQAALKWIQQHYTLDHNPNMPNQQSLQGLYYYYHVFARALRAWGEPVITDGKGVKHSWREDLCRKLIALQNKDGSWVNTADRWYEGNPALVTAYSVLAMQTALK